MKLKSESKLKMMKKRKWSKYKSNGRHYIAKIRQRHHMIKKVGVQIYG